MMTVMAKFRLRAINGGILMPSFLEMRRFTAARPPLRYEVWDYVKQRLLKFRQVRMAGLAIGGLGIAAAVHFYSPSGKAKSLIGVFEAGGLSGWDQVYKRDLHAAVRRDAMVDDLSRLFRQKEICKFGLVVGEHGTGKSTLVRQAVRQVPGDGVNGVVYFEVPKKVSTFSTELQQCLGYTLHEPDLLGGIIRRINYATVEERMPDTKDEPSASFQILGAALLQAATQFKEKHGRPMTLVLDGIEWISREAPGFLLELQRMAKQCADRNQLLIVFVISDNAVVEHMQNDSTFSRAGAPYEVGDITDEEAIHYLLAKHPDLSKDRATDAVLTITGGRFGLLTTFEEAYHKKTNDDIRSELYEMLGSHLKGDSAILPLDNHFWKMLLDAPVGRSKALDTKVSKKQLSQLTEANILAFHPNQTYTFHSRYVLHYFRSMAGMEQKS